MIDQTIGGLPLFLMIAAFILPLATFKIKSKVFYHAYATGVTAVALVLSIINLLIVRRDGTVIYFFGGWPPPLGIVYEVDAISAFFGVLVASIMFLAVLYSIWYMREFDGVEWYYVLMLGLTAGSIGCVYTGDAFNLFVMIEVLSVAAYALVAFFRSKPEALEAAIRYGLVGATATTMYFLALVFLYGSFGTVNMADLALKMRPWIVTSNPEVVHYFNQLSGSLFGNPVLGAAVAIALSLWAFTFKAALFPNHFWLPDANPEAPTPVSAVFAAVIDSIGIYAVLRFMYTIFGPDSLLATGTYMNIRAPVMTILFILGLASALVGALLLAIQKDVKKLLAYSAISHVGFIFMGLSVGTSAVSENIRILAIGAVIYHVLSNSIGEALLFFTSGVFIMSTGSRNLDVLAGLGRRYPVALVGTIIGVLHLFGIPPLAGFFSKYALFMAMLDAGNIIGAVALVAITGISLLGYVRFMYIIWLGRPREEVSLRIKSEPLTAVIPIVLLVAASVVLGVAVQPVLKELIMVADTSFSAAGVTRYISAAVDLLRLLQG
ncbi:MAG: cation:proton antiporter [Desulfurococcales archaeon]|nr:cation:proton antiporter [Desulfurococcales archaeon]